MRYYVYYCIFSRLLCEQKKGSLCRKTCFAKKKKKNAFWQSGTLFCILNLERKNTIIHVITDIKIK